MDQGKTQINGPHQGGWVELKSGENWFVHFQDRGAYGRVVHLQPIKWTDDWPVMGNDKDKSGKGEPVLEYPCWAAPIVSHGLLYLRGKDRLICLELIPQ